MAAKVLDAGYRVFVNEDFVDEIVELFPETSTAIGKGWQVNLGKTSKDVLLFTDHSPVEGLKGACYVMTCSGGTDYALERIDLTRQWIAKHGSWGFERAAATSPSGLYGYTKAVQGCCEGAIRKLSRRASRIVRAAVGRDERVLDFLQRHAKRNHSKTAKILVSAYQESMPKFAKVAAAAELGMYGIGAKTVKIGLNACSELNEAAGGIVANLHSRKPDLYKNVVGFLGKNAKEAGCMYSRLLSSCYPDCD